MSIGIISNPRSGKNKKDPNEMKKLGYILGNNGETHETYSIEDVYKVAETFKKNGVEILCINGGDGTNHVTLSIFIEVYGDTPLPKIAILRGGTMNTVANAFNIKGKPKDILVNIIQKYYAKEPFKVLRRGVLKIDDNKYGFIFGNGVVYNFLNLYYSNKNPSPIIAAKELVKSIKKSFFNKDNNLFKEQHFDITDENGNSWKNSNYMSVIASTVDNLGLGFAPLNRSDEDPNMFHILGLKQKPIKLSLTLPKIWFNMGLSKSLADQKIAKKIILKSDKPFGYTIDGDMHTPVEELKIEMGPQLDFIIK